jgi:preprotein translocase subunit YajC
MDWNWITLAMGAPGNQPQGPGSALQMFVPMIIIFAIFYFMLIRPQQRKEKERKAMIDAVESGARILFSGGIVGTVTNVKDNILVVKIADNVKIEIARGAVNRVLDKSEKPGKEDA